PLELLQELDGPVGVLRAVERKMADELPADHVRADAAEADAGVAERAGDLRAEPRFVAALDLHAVHHAGSRYAGGERGRFGLLAFDRTDDQHAAARLLRQPAREQHLQADLRPGELLQHGGGAAGAILDGGGPDVVAFRLECHASLPRRLRAAHNLLPGGIGW